LNNTARRRAGAFCVFHRLHQSGFENYLFVRNWCETVANSIYVESVDSIASIAECAFSAQREDEIRIRFDGSVVNVRESRFEADEQPETALPSPRLPKRVALKVLRPGD
jgi:hypothetical protein